MTISAMVMTKHIMLNMFMYLDIRDFSCKFVKQLLNSTQNVVFKYYSVKFEAGAPFFLRFYIIKAMKLKFGTSS